jgi:hypothetical protein
MRSIAIARVSCGADALRALGAYPEPLAAHGSIGARFGNHFLNVIIGQDFFAY